ncbi:MAG: uroporphyrinogen decarboxylase family protein, partial [Egibacteraceae bacterium]
MTQQAQDDHYRDDRTLAWDYAGAVNAELRDLQAAGADVVQIDEPYLQARHENAERYALEVINRAFEGITTTKALHTCFGYAQVIKNKPSAYPFLAELNDCAADMIAVEAAQPRLDMARLADLSDKTMIVGVLDLGDLTVETPEQVADRLRAALEYVSADRLVAAPDCGMKYLPREVARGKLGALVAGAALVRNELE